MTDSSTINRRSFLTISAAGGAAVATLLATSAPVLATSDQWDKVFAASDQVIHRKVTFPNRFGITLSADIYTPKEIDTTARHAALVVAHPFGGVKEQAAGLYAQTLAERGFVTLAFDASYHGESGGEPRELAAAETWVEDFSAAVDYLGGQPFVDRERIGAIGVCGGGGFGLAAAATDPRIKAVATSAMYDIGQANRQGLSESLDLGAMRQRLNDIAAQRWAEVDGADRLLVGAMPETLPEGADPVTTEFFGYYATPVGFHPRATRGFDSVSHAWMTSFWSFDKLPWISPRPVLFITGETAHSRHFSEQAFEMATEPRELVVVPGAGHVDLYHRMDLIPWERLESFFQQHLA